MGRRAGFTSLFAAVALLLSGCGFSPSDLPLPGGADLGDNPYTVKAEFRDAMDLVKQGGVRSSDVTVGKITDVQLKRGSWTAVVTMKINGNTKLPDNALATIRQTSLLGEKFVSIDAPPGGGTGELGNGDVIGLDRTGRNPELEEVLSATALLFNGGALDKVNVITRELNQLLDGRETDLRDLIENATTFTQILDRNKGAMIVALERINRLAVSTNAQEAQIDEALRDIPPALRVLDDQRDDLIRMLDSLEGLSDVATDVIKKSKKNLLLDLKLLEPVLKGLADAGDGLVGSLRGLITFPFSDGFMGDSVAVAEAACPANTVAVVRAGDCFGDYINLDINLKLNEQQAQLLILALLATAGIPVPTAAATAPAAATTAASEDGAPAATAAAPLDPAVAAAAKTIRDAVNGTTGAVTNLVQPSATPTKAPAAAKKDGLCGLVGLLCRTPAVSFAQAQQTDIGRLLVGPAVAK